MADASRFPQGAVLRGVNIATTATPLNTVVESGGRLYISTDAGTPSYVAIGGGTVNSIASGQFTCTTQSTNVTVTGIAVTDIGLAVVDTDDTGSTLGGIQVCRAAGSNTLVVITNNAPSVNVDGVIKWIVFRPI